MSMLNETALKAQRQHFLYVDEIPEPIKTDLLSFLYGRTLGSEKGKMIVYQSDFRDWLKKVWENGLSKTD